MEYINFKTFKKRLKDSLSLKHEKIGLVKRNKSVAWSIPVERKPNVKVLQYISTTRLINDVGYWINDLIEASKTRGSNVALGIVDRGGEHICYLVVDESLAD